MKNKILVITTRGIFEKDMIFEGAHRSDTVNKSLKKYIVDYLNGFLNDNNISGAPKVVQVYREKKQNAPRAGGYKDQQSSIQEKSLSQDQSDEIQSFIESGVFPQETIEILNSYSNDTDWLECIKEKCDETKESSKDEKVKNRIDSLLDLIGPYLPLSPAQKKEEDSKDLQMKYSDLDDYLDYEAVNIDKNPAEFTIRDRVSLYSVLPEELSEENGKTIKYMVYATWPLGSQDDSNEDENGDLSSGWVDTLTDAVIAESKVALKETEIILLLHDNDLRSTKKTPFRTVYADKEYNGSKRTLAVYEHSNVFFHKIINHKGTAKDVYSNAEKIIIDDWKVSYLKELSHILASYKGEGDKESLEKKYQAVKEVFNIENSNDEFLPNVNDLIGDPENSEMLFAANQEINDLIKELRYKEE